MAISNAFHPDPNSRTMKVFIPFHSLYDPQYHRCLETLEKIGYEEVHLIQMVALDLISRDRHFSVGRRQHVEDIYTSIDYCDVEMFYDNVTVEHQQPPGVNGMPTFYEVVDAFEEAYVIVYAFMDLFFQGIHAALGMEWYASFVSIDNAVPGRSLRDQDLDLTIEFQRIQINQNPRGSYEAGI